MDPIFENRPTSTEDHPHQPGGRRFPGSHGLWVRFMSLFGGANLIVTIILAVMIVSFVYRTEQEAWQGRQSEAALNAAATVGSFVQRAVDALALAALWGRDEIRAKPDHIHEALDYTPAFLEAVYLDEDGQILAHAHRDHAVLAHLFTIPQSAWFSEARAGRVYLSDVQLSAADTPYLILAYPAGTAEVIAVRLDLTELWKVVADIHFGDQGRAYIVNERGVVIAHTTPAIVLAQTNLTGRPELTAVTQAPDRRWQGGYVDLAGIQVVGASAPVTGTDWLIITELPETEAFKASQAAWLTLGGGTVLLGVGLSFLVARLLDSLIRKPLQRLQAGVDRIGQGDLQFRVAVIHRDEIGIVAEAFNHMADHLKARDVELTTQTMALQASEARYRAIVEDQTELVCRWRSDGTLTFVNEAYCRYFGRRREDLEGHSFMPLIPDGDHALVDAFVARLGPDHRTETIEHRVILADGGVRWLQWTDRALIDSNGAATEFAGVGRDITERKAAEAQVKLLEQYYRSLFEEAPVMYIVTRAEADGPHVVDCNHQFLQTLGYAQTEVIGHSLGQFYVHESREQLLNGGYAGSLAGQLTSQECQLAGYDGRIIQTLLWAVPALNVQGQPIGTRELYVDVTELKQAEAALRASELAHRQLADELQLVNSQLETRVGERTAELARANAALSASETRLRRITDNMLDMIAQVDSLGRYEYVSPSHQAVLGYTMGELCGRYMADFVHPDDAALTTIEPGASSSWQIRVRHAVGHYVWLESVSSPLRDEAGRLAGAIISSRNITSRRQVEQRAAAFSELGYQLSSADTPEAAAQVIVTTADMLFGWDVSFLDVYLADQDLLRSVIFIDTLDDGQRRNTAADSPAYAPTATTRRVMTEGPLLIRREGPNELIPGLTYWGDSSRSPGSLMFVPIRNGLQFVGLLSIQSYHDQAYDPAALQTLQALADHCGSALERIRAETAVRASLHEKEVMLQEIHHRVKNNLQVVSSLLNLQSRAVSDPQALEVLRDSQNRVRSMALVHEKLYRSTDLARIDLAEYARSLAGQLLHTYAKQAGRVALRVEAVRCWVGIDTSIACGLILNELVSNVLKHAFPGDRAGEIVLAVHPTERQRVMLRVADDGVGFPPEVDFRATPSLGLQLVNSLVTQIDGTITLNRGAGTEFLIEFPASGRAE